MTGESTIDSVQAELLEFGRRHYSLIHETVRERLVNETIQGFRTTNGCESVMFEELAMTFSANCDQWLKDIFGRVMDAIRIEYPRLGDASLRDCIQESVLNIQKSRIRKPPPKNLFAYLKTSARRLCSRQLKKRDAYSRRTVELYDMPSTSMSGEQIAHFEWRSMAVKHAIDSLSEKNRIAILLRYDEGMSYKECAEELGIKLDAFRNRLRQALGRLAAALTSQAESYFP